MARDEEAVVDALAVRPRQARADRHVREALRRDELVDGRHDVDLAARRILQQGALVDPLARDDEGDAVALVHRRRLVDVVAVAVIADDDDEALGALRLDRLDELCELAVGVPVVAEFLQELLVLLVVFRQCGAHGLLIEAFGLEVEVIRRVVRGIEQDIEARRVRVEAVKDLLVEHLILTAPDTARHIAEVAAAVEVVKALCLREGADALPSGRPCIPEVRRVAELLHLRGAGRRVRRSEGLRHRRQVEVGIGEVRHDTRDSRDRARAIRQERRAVVRVILRDEAAHAMRDGDILVLVEQRPVCEALRQDNDDLLGLLDLRSLRFLRQIDVEVIRIGGLARKARRQIADVLRREVEAVAGQHALIEVVGAVDGLHVVKNGLIEELVLRDTGVLPVDGRLPAQAAAEDAEQHGDVRQVEEGQPAEPAHGRGQAHTVHAVLEPAAAKQGAQAAPEDVGEQQGPCKAHGQVVLLHHRDEERVNIVVGPREEHLVEVRVELPVERKARDKEDREHREQHAVEREHNAPLPARPEIMEQQPRHEAHERQRAGRLHREAEAAP